MPLIIGILADVSGSMKNCVDRPYRQGRSWSHSIVRVVDELIKQDVSEDELVFTCGFGAPRNPVHFDLLNSVKQGLTINTNQFEHWRLDLILEEILGLLENNGAPYVRNWTNVEQLTDAVSHDEAKLVLAMLHGNLNFRHRFVSNCLPKECRERFNSLRSFGTESVRKTAGFVGYFSPTVRDSWNGATKVSIREAVDEGISLIWDICSVSFGHGSVMGVKEAHGILHEYTDDKELTDTQVRKLMKAIDPFIYGRTPMKQAVEEAERLFASPEYRYHTKLLFVLSDGMPDDRHFHIVDRSIHVVGCFITDEFVADPKHLYSTDCDKFVGGAEFMFHLSSSIATEKLPSLRHGWTVDHTTNETKLFFQIDDPKLIKDVCNFVKDVACSQNALSEIASIALDLYIHDYKDEFDKKEREKQVGATCYAHSVATAMHLAMKRIEGREGGYPDFLDLKNELVKRYGIDGGITCNVLQEVCPKYRLRCKEVDLNGAKSQITEKCPVVASFYFRGYQWASFGSFFENNRTGILTLDELNKTNKGLGKDAGHAVVLTTFNHECFRFMNSWGSKWGDNGFFRAEKAIVVGWKFYAVYWEINDLTAGEKRAFHQMGAEKMQETMTKYKAFRTAEYVCPSCKRASKVVQFTGELRKAKCPKCNDVFDTKEDDIVLNAHLTSVCVNSTY